MHNCGYFCITFFIQIIEYILLCLQSMHWATPKTKDRMLPDQQGVSSNSSGLSAGQPNPAHRRASEGGAALYFGNRKAEWGTDNSDVANKFRNYEI